MPYFRHDDVQREADLIEEVARVHGLQRLPATLPARKQAIGGLSREQKLRRAVEDLLRGARPERGRHLQLHLAGRGAHGCASRATTRARACCRSPTRSARTSR